jgi:glycosyltransferase involved in cell wall biosynthesis
LKKIAIIGTNGLPAKYGGFETLVEYLVQYLSNQYEITVFSSGVTCNPKLKEYDGCKLEYINLKANGWQSVIYDFWSIFRSRKFDRVIILGASGGILMPLFSKYNDKFILNFGGLDWQRSKWNYFTRKFLKISEYFSIKYSKHLISDNKGIQEYIISEYGRESSLVTYGGDQSFKVDPMVKDFEQYPFLKNDYAFTVARIQSDNNIELILNAFDKKDTLPLVFVGNWNNSDFGIKTKKRYSAKKNIILLNAIYAPRELNLLRSNCKIYIHGHSAGGTNPALLEAMNVQLPILAYDCKFNRYTTEGEAKYFLDSEKLFELLNNINCGALKKISKNMLEISSRRYTWEKIANEYAKVIEESLVC